MSDQNLSLLLQEFRAFRDNEFKEFRNDVATWKQETGERVMALETTVGDGLIDNGQPSRLTVVERKVSVLERITWIASGVILTIQGTIALVIEWRPWSHK